MLGKNKTDDSSKYFLIIFQVCIITSVMIGAAPKKANSLLKDLMI